VTDILVARGTPEVVTSVAANDGAHISGSGFLHLVKRSADDSILAEHLGLRKDIPRHVFQQLISKASDEVRKKLERERPGMGNQIQAAVTDVTGTIHAKFGPASKNYFAAKRIVGKLHEYGSLNEDKIFEFAHSLKFNETAVDLSLLCVLPNDVVERAFGRQEQGSHPDSGQGPGSFMDHDHVVAVSGGGQLSNYRGRPRPHEA